MGLICASLTDSSLIVAILALSVLILAVACFAMVARIFTFFTYHKYNKINAACNLTARDAAMKLLEQKGLSEVEVKKASWFRALVWGNSYAPNKKTIFLRRGIIDKTSMTAIAMACQKVGLVEQHFSGDAKYKVYAKLVPYCPFAPLLLFPMILVGVVLDLLFFNFSGVFTLVVAIIGFLFYVAAFVLTILNVPVEKKATDLAYQTINETGILNDQEMVAIKKLYKGYIVDYVCQMLIAVLEIIKFILQIISSARK